MIFLTETETQFSHDFRAGAKEAVCVYNKVQDRTLRNENWDAQRAARSVPKHDAEVSETGINYEKTRKSR